MNTFTAVPVVLAGVLAAAAAPGTDLAIKALSPAEDAAVKTVLIGRSVAADMIVSLELEAAKSMWMPIGNPSRWVEHPVAKGELFHVEVKPVDPASKTRIPYADVKFSAVNLDNKQQVTGTLHPMWGGSGLHYATNSPLAGDGVYAATVTVGVPAFGRSTKDRQQWFRPVSSRFHFKLSGTKIVEVTEAIAEAR